MGTPCDPVRNLCSTPFNLTRLALVPVVDAAPKLLARPGFTTVGPVGLEPTTRGLKVVPRWAVLTAVTLRRCRARCEQTCQRQRSWLYSWLYRRRRQRPGHRAPYRRRKSATGVQQLVGRSAAHVLGLARLVEPVAGVRDGAPRHPPGPRGHGEADSVEAHDSDDDEAAATDGQSCLIERFEKRRRRHGPQRSEDTRRHPAEGRALINKSQLRQPSAAAPRRMFRRAGTRPSSTKLG